MRILITGAGGFAGRHLIAHLNNIHEGAEIHGTIYSQSENRNLPPNASYHQLDLLDEEATYQLLNDIKPEQIYHLAGQSSPSKALNALWATLETNIRAQLNLLQICVELNIAPRIMTISSGDIYVGGASEPDLMPVDETAELRPGNPYALSKVTQDLMGLQYFLSYRLPVIRVRPFNHTGPGQRETFVAPDFALQIAKIEAGLQAPTMSVGNLEAKRDFTDVRDVVKAYHLLMQKGEPGEVYNVSANQAYSIQYLLDTLLSFSDAEIDVQIDAAKMRPVDVPLVQGDNSRLHKLTGWTGSIAFEDTLRDLLEDCRQRVEQLTRS